jgi:hypothetical protein
MRERNAEVVHALLQGDNKPTKCFLKINFLHGIYVEGLYLLKIILLREIGMAVKHVCFVHKMRQLNIYSSNATLLVLYGQSSNQHQACTLLLVLPISLGISFMVQITSI